MGHVRTGTLFCMLMLLSWCLVGSVWAAPASRPTSMRVDKKNPLEQWRLVQSGVRGKKPGRKQIARIMRWFHRETSVRWDAVSWFVKWRIKDKRMCHRVLGELGSTSSQQRLQAMKWLLALHWNVHRPGCAQKRVNKALIRVIKGRDTRLHLDALKVLALVSTTVFANKFVSRVKALKKPEDVAALFLSIADAPGIGGYHYGLRYVLQGLAKQHRSVRIFLIKRLKQMSSKQRLYALRAMGYLPGEFAKRCGVFAPLFALPEKRQRTKIIAILGLTGYSCRHLLPALRHRWDVEKDVVVRIEILRTMAKIAKASELALSPLDNKVDFGTVLPVFRLALRDPSVLVQKIAIRILGYTTSRWFRQAEQLLRKAVLSSSPDVRKAVYQSLLWLPIGNRKTTFIRFLVERVKLETHAGVLVSAFQTLCYVGRDHKYLLPLLLKGLRHRKLAVRLAALRGLSYVEPTGHLSIAAVMRDIQLKTKKEKLAVLVSLRRFLPTVLPVFAHWSAFRYTHMSQDFLQLLKQHPTPHLAGELSWHLRKRHRFPDSLGWLSSYIKRLNTAQSYTVLKGYNQRLLYHSSAMTEAERKVGALHLSLLVQKSPPDKAKKLLLRGLKLGKEEYHWSVLQALGALPWRVFPKRSAQALFGRKRTPYLARAAAAGFGRLLARKPGVHPALKKSIVRAFLGFKVSDVSFETIVSWVRHSAKRGVFASGERASEQRKFHRSVRTLLLRVLTTIGEKARTQRALRALLSMGPSEEGKKAFAHLLKHGTHHIRRKVLKAVLGLSRRARELAPALAKHMRSHSSNEQEYRLLLRCFARLAPASRVYFDLFHKYAASSRESWKRYVISAGKKLLRRDLYWGKAFVGRLYKETNEKRLMRYLDILSSRATLVPGLHRYLPGALKHPNPNVRQSALWALHKMKFAPSFVLELAWQRLQEDPSRDVRWYAAWLFRVKRGPLQITGDVYMQRLWQHSLVEPSVDVRREIYHALSKLGGRMPWRKWLLQALARERDDMTRSRILQILGKAKLYLKRQLAVHIDLMGRGERSLRRTIGYVHMRHRLDATPRSSGHTWVMLGASDRMWRKRLGAARRHGTISLSSIHEIVDVVQWKRNRKLRRSALRLLSFVRAKAALPRLLLLLKREKDRRMRYSILFCIEKIRWRSKQISKALRVMLHTKDQEMQARIVCAFANQGRVARPYLYFLMRRYVMYEPSRYKEYCGARLLRYVGRAAMNYEVWLYKVFLSSPSLGARRLAIKTLYFQRARYSSRMIRLLKQLSRAPYSSEAGYGVRALLRWKMLFQKLISTPAAVEVVERWFAREPRPHTRLFIELLMWKAGIGAYRVRNSKRAAVARRAFVKKLENYALHSRVLRLRSLGAWFFSVLVNSHLWRDESADRRLAAVAIPTLIKVVRREKLWHIRRNALSSLGYIKARPALVLPVLRQALRDPHPFARRIALWSIGQFGARAKHLSPSVKAMQRSANGRIRSMARSVLRKINPKVSKPTRRPAYKPHQ